MTAAPPPDRGEAPVAPPGTILVTGSAGFIGRHLVRHLTTSGYRVHGYDREASGRDLPGYTEHVGDLLDPERLAKTLALARPAAVVHLAARTDLDERCGIAGYAANTDGVTALLDALADAPSVGRVVCTSSQLVCTMGYRPTRDDDYQPTTTYGESKVETERRWRAADGAGRSWCLVRPTTIWGPGMNPHYLTFFRLVRDGRYVHVAGGPTLKSYGFVGNTVDQYRRLLEAPAADVHRRTFYLADDPPIALEDWAEGFRRALDAPRIRTLPRALARTLALIGDGVRTIGVSRFPFTSFRLANVITPSVVELAPTLAVCGPPPIDVEAGTAATVRWLRRVWDGASRWEID